jgi:sucrose-phosphate synthase
LILLEALAAGLPVVAARQGGPAEILRAGCGELARPGDPSDFASKIRSVLERPDRGAECRRHVEAHCSWDATFRGLLDVYLSAVEERARAPLARPAVSSRRLEPVKR